MHVCTKDLEHSQGEISSKWAYKDEFSDLVFVRVSRIQAEGKSNYRSLLWSFQWIDL